MSIRDPQPPQLNLARGLYQPDFFVDLQSFFEFSFWMAEELLDLEARFRPVRRPVKLRYPVSIGQQGAAHRASE